MASTSRWLIGVAVALWTCGLAAQAVPPRVAARDQVKVTVVGTEIPAGPFTVEADGTIDYPFVGRVKAEGLTARELASEIARRLVAAEVLVGSPQVTIDLQQLATKKVTVSGAVSNKGEFMFAGDLSVFSALVKAGGAAPDAGDEILLIRAPKAGAPTADAEDVVTLSRRQVESGEFDRANLVEDGDRIVVNRARQVYIDGQVSRPGGYTIEAGTTLRQALSLAGGVTELGAVNRIRVLRSGKRVEKIDLDKTVVQPGDTITVPKRFM
jgi:polysaccharide export outer membrane protein